MCSVTSRAASGSRETFAVSKNIAATQASGWVDHQLLLGVSQGASHVFDVVKDLFFGDL
ncbi:MAG: hypothetical protein KatS3mg077_1370 [Candidatus Binatia bacterium]|nr:MAG: hypothetical protein KatS3mg077_1370 [Candidatus Binatia bacterium]